MTLCCIVLFLLSFFLLSTHSYASTQCLFLSHFLSNSLESVVGQSRAYVYLARFKFEFSVQWLLFLRKKMVRIKPAKVKKTGKMNEMTEKKKRWDGDTKCTVHFSIHFYLPLPNNEPSRWVRVHARLLFYLVLFGRPTNGGNGWPLWQWKVGWNGKDTKVQCSATWQHYRHTLTVVILLLPTL